MSLRLPQSIRSRIEQDRLLWVNFEEICALGGRQCGSVSERLAVEMLADRGTRYTGIPARREPVPYRGWKARSACLVLADGKHPCWPLIYSGPATGLEAEVVDLGRGTPDDFADNQQALCGRVALVRHELMFSPGKIHRAVKYRAAVEAGAAGFLIAGPEPGNCVAGGITDGEGNALPALGITPETAARLARRDGGFPRVGIELDTVEEPSSADNLLFDMPASGPGQVVLSAHVDGHGISESAIDNASGLAVALAVARALAPEIPALARGLRLAFFNVEEWYLAGSRRHVEKLADDERSLIALNVNLDSVAGGNKLTALTSGFSNLGPFLGNVARENGHELGIHEPFQPNSDHANFAQAGIPAFRLVAGFDDPGAATRLVLTPQDTRSLVKPEELIRTALLSAATVLIGLR